MMWSAWRWVTKTARTSGRSGPNPGLHRQPGPPELAVHAFAAVDEVDGVADDDGVGVPAAADLGVPPPPVPSSTSRRPEHRCAWERRPWLTGA